MTNHAPHRDLYGVFWSKSLETPKYYHIIPNEIPIKKGVFHRGLYVRGRELKMPFFAVFSISVEKLKNRVFRP